jgi:glycosyltransferase involved in cell wall biosynthesis
MYFEQSTQIKRKDIASSTHERQRKDSAHLTLAVCSNRTENIRSNWKQYLNILRQKDKLLLILDTEENPVVKDLISEAKNTRVKIILNGKNLGLSESRNIVLKNCKTELLVFIDDDITLPANTLELIRMELDKGSDIVGVMIREPVTGIRLPWYITNGQLHYLAIHNTFLDRFTTWGACMGLNMLFLRKSKIQFRNDLGRKGSQLQSGDDTTFLNEMKVRGAKERFLKEVYVFHNIDSRRLSLKYMLRRSYWQGRSEIRRSNGINGLAKEWNRFVKTNDTFPKKMFLAFIYSSSLILGMMTEILIGRK